MYIIGLDVSTSSTGYCVMNNSKKIYKYGAVELSHEKDFYKKVEILTETIKQLKKEYDECLFYIEKPFEYFSSGKSSASTMALLLKFNAVISWNCYLLNNNKEPVHVTPLAARTSLGIKIDTKQGHTKQKILEWVTKEGLISVVDFTRFGNPKSFYYDVADAVVIALYGTNEYLKEELCLQRKQL